MKSLEELEAAQLQDELVGTSTTLAKEAQVRSELEARYLELKSKYDALVAQQKDYDEVINGDVQALLDRKGEGARISIPPGTYRLTKPLEPKKNQKIFCNGAEFKGSITIGAWEKEGNYYVATGLLPDVYNDAGVCEIVEGLEANGCRVLEDVFNGGEKLERVMTLSSLGSGKVYSDYFLNKIYIADVPDNVEVALTRFFMRSSVDGVRVCEANVLHFASPSQQGALTISGKHWEVDNCLFAYNHSSGLHVTGADGLWVHENTFEFNGQAGMTHHKTNDSIIRQNYFDSNNTNGYYRRDWESAGLKITYSQRVTVDTNWVEGNLGVGIWCDIDNKDITITNNTIRNNFSCGIRYEISFEAAIKYNKIDGNGYGHAGPGRGSDYSAFATAGIHINSSGGDLLLIEGNTLGKNQNGIHIEERNRGKSPTYGVAWAAKNVKVLNNTVNISRALDAASKPVYGTGVVGIGQLGTVVSDVYKAGIEFEGNKYITNNINDSQFHIKDTAINQYKTFGRWQQLGYDKTGSITVA